LDNVSLTRFLHHQQWGRFPLYYIHLFRTIPRQKIKATGSAPAILNLLLGFGWMCFVLSRKSNRLVTMIGTDELYFLNTWIFRTLFEHIVSLQFKDLRTPPTWKENVCASRGTVGFSIDPHHFRDVAFSGINDD
jgi:hypothetical protein